MAPLQSQPESQQGNIYDDGVKVYTYDPQSNPPEFGHAMLKYFGFEKGYINLNHGSYGSLPNPVLAACNELTSHIEANPDRFLRLTFASQLEVVRSRVAELLKVHTDEIVVVPNASHGVNTVLRNFDWRKEDIIIGATTTYGAVTNTIQYLSDIHPHPTISTFHLEFPTTHEDILLRWRKHLNSLPAHLSPSSHPDPSTPSPSTLPKVVAVIDSIISNPGVLLPWREMVKICQEEGVWSVVDGAHSIGQEVGIDLGSLGVDFMVSNCHKWMYAKRGCAVLYVPKRNQRIIKSAIPTGWFYKSPSDPDAPNFVPQFTWTGTTDMVPYLSIGPALDFRKWIGGEEKINAYCHNLAVAGGKRLAEILGTSVMENDKGELTVNMVNVELPLPGVPFTPEVTMTLQTKLMYEWNCYAAHYLHNGRWWTRCSAQIWNQISDFDYLGSAFGVICKEVTEKYGKVVPN
ncbi:hypothetical protein JAAARDRAFT_35958 [Jaapia argillacea MUCL 33604]|uniref:Aminotransferase class V domain-containing protein n=1 Tax=Jaapia argillacea MUCL 33604 TaxID=933084 RepID=A0A067Q1E9_9AGAM|nr:hypothetical protein JAAARDRAFT_35958 [Jaapia argillacea MUCL 33604]